MTVHMQMTWRDTPAHENLAHAWEQRRARLGDELVQAGMAPALFKPEHVEQLRRAFAHATRQVAYWSTVGAS